MDVFKGQTTDAVQNLLKKNHIFSTKVPANMTGKGLVSLKELKWVARSSLPSILFMSLTHWLLMKKNMILVKRSQTNKDQLADGLTHYTEDSDVDSEWEEEYEEIEIFLKMYFSDLIHKENIKNISMKLHICFNSLCFIVFLRNIKNKKS